MTREEAKHTLIHIYRQCMWAKECEEYGCEVCEDALNMAIEALQREDDLLKSLETNEPIYDMVEVVRCKDCIHYESDGGALMVCGIGDMVVDDTDYCSYGERKGGDDE